MYFTIVGPDGKSYPADQFEFIAYKTDEHGDPTEEVVLDGNVGEALAAYYPDNED